MFIKSATLYDAIYSWKNYADESEKIHALIQKHKRSPGSALLDVGCGTGAHIAHLKNFYAVEGLDLDEQLLEVARQRHPSVAFHHGDMAGFNLNRTYDVIVSLFSAIGYVKTVTRLNQTIHTMARHLAPGGVILIEPWFTPDQFHIGTPHAVIVNEPDLKIARMNVSKTEGTVSILDFHYLVATSGGVEYFTEVHELGLFTVDEHLQAFRECGLEVIHDPEGIFGRGLYIGIK
jgi:ubiquinone/menaquinone biosynthesis C-methylase UbiE